jgi:1,6-anhydro-N-acetylmuramate kinase
MGRFVLVGLSQAAEAAETALGARRAFAVQELFQASFCAAAKVTSVGCRCR